MPKQKVPESSRICSIASRSMKRWSNFSPSAKVVVESIGERKWWIAYDPNGPSYWHANVIGDVFYLLSIEIPQTIRGKGLGNELYEIIERIASEIGCSQIRQTPSGETATGESRLCYLIRRDWFPDGLEVFKKLDQTEEIP